MATTEERIAKVEGLLEEVRQGLRDTNTRLNLLDQRLTWMWLSTLGAILTTFLTLLGIILTR